MQPAQSGPELTASARQSTATSGPPPAGMGVGPSGHRPANSSSGEVSPTRYASLGPTWRGKESSWTAATGPRAGAYTAGARPSNPKYPWWGRAGRDAGGLPRATVAGRGGREDLALPLTPGHRRRRHFAFHSMSPPPHSVAGFPDVGISRRRLRGGRRLGASARSAAARERETKASEPS
ncbi:hypothetical protein P7K49_008756 [Saguinus oedipus]|uniref:Uncharacterized protein n=1 Tax=Saguinus oedipus TaxID=9490 RepID=A0ABQ9VZ76_SAGOE|nr:hypothetical protein P7K49_008756 [Saguinus oedipus]